MTETGPPPDPPGPAPRGRGRGRRRAAADVAWEELVGLRARADQLGIGWADDEPLGALRQRVADAEVEAQP
jgi:hypothetical protein